MFSYIFMKILENRPERYDAGINLLSGGHASKIRKQIVREFVKPGMDVLDIGCGTGVLLVEATKAGAQATGVDISAGMIAVARKRVARVGEQDHIELHNAGVVEIDSLFEENRFDLVVSTLVFSELYYEERALALQQIRKLLKPGGTLVIAVEVRPRKLLQRMIHFLLRLPLAVVTYLIAQTGTKPFAQINEEVSQAGFKILNEERSFLDSFTILSARNAEGTSSSGSPLPEVRKPKSDFSLTKSVWDFVGRWFPNPVEPGLRVIGNPDATSPVILTSNFHLTVRRVEKSLRGENVYLLVAPTNGINVWCAACGGEFNTHSAITAIKTSRIRERVRHSQIVLPQFSAPGIDTGLLKQETGCSGLFGPAYAKDLPAFLKSHKTVFAHNQAQFPLAFRWEMLLSMNLLVWLAVGIVVLLLAPGLFWPISIAFWVAGLILYSGYPIIPGNSGWLKAGVLSLVEVVAIALFSVLIWHQPLFHHWDIMVIVSAINLWLGFDLRGIVAGNSSEAEWLMHKLDMNSFGHIFSADAYSPGKIRQDIDRCNDCRLCLRVCPKGVYGIDENRHIRLERQEECFACNACVVQCGEEALSLR